MELVAVRGKEVQLLVNNLTQRRMQVNTGNPYV